MPDTEVATWAGACEERVSVTAPAVELLNSTVPSPAGTVNGEPPTGVPPIVTVQVPELSPAKRYWAVKECVVVMPGNVLCSVLPRACI